MPKSRRTLRHAPSFAWFFLAAACHSGNAVPAAVGLGVAVAAAGINRAVTHQCWAQCGVGYYCDEESGLCQQGECIPPCASGQSCLRDLDGQLVCATDPTTVEIGRPPKKVYSTGPGPWNAGPMAPRTGGGSAGAGGAGAGDAVPRDAGLADGGPLDAGEEDPDRAVAGARSR